MLVPNRHGSSAAYRYGFNGQEKDNEIKGDENSINYEARIHDPRVGRFLSVDPLTKQFAWYSPYQFAGNTPIWAIDLDGEEQYYYQLKLAKNSEGKPVIAVDRVEVVDNLLPNCIEPDVHRLRDLDGSLFEFHFDSRKELMETIHGKTLEQIREASRQEFKDRVDAFSYAIGDQVRNSIDETITDELNSGDGNFDEDVEDFDDGPRYTPKTNMPNATPRSPSEKISTSGGRTGKQARIKAIATDRLESKTNRGWVTNEARRIKFGNGSKNYRMPFNGRKSPGRLTKDKGLELAHPHNAPASKGGSYAGSKVKNHADHKVETKLHRKKGRY